VGRGAKGIADGAKGAVGGGIGIYNFRKI
jgi:hypothetical protein